MKQYIVKVSDCAVHVINCACPPNCPGNIKPDWRDKPDDSTDDWFIVTPKLPGETHYCRVYNGKGLHFPKLIGRDEFINGNPWPGVKWFPVYVAPPPPPDGEQEKSNVKA